MNRSIWKVQNILRKYKTKIYQRGMTISNIGIDQVFKIHNGHGLVGVVINEDMLNHKFGEFSLTKKYNVKSRRKKQKIKK